MVICDNSKDSRKSGFCAWLFDRDPGRCCGRDRGIRSVVSRFPPGRYDREAPNAACQRGGCGVRPVGARCQCQRDAVPARWGRCQAGGCAVSVSARCGVSAVGAVPSRWVRGVSASAMCARPGVSAVGARCQRCGCVWVRAWVCAPRCTGRSPARTSAWMVATARWTGMPQARAQTGRGPGSGDHVSSYITRVSGFGMVPGRYCRYDSHLGR
jgi:hypothetical protein